MHARVSIELFPATCLLYVHSRADIKVCAAHATSGLRLGGNGSNDWIQRRGLRLLLLLYTRQVGDFEVDKVGPAIMFVSVLENGIVAAVRYLLDATSYLYSC